MCPDNASFISQAVPRIMRAGETYGVSVTLQNTGSTPWVRSERQSYRLQSLNPQIWGATSIQLPPGKVVKPGDVHTFEWNIAPPLKQASVPFQWQMVHEAENGSAPFGQPTPGAAVSNAFVRIVDHRFMIDQTPFYPYGINYFPLYGVVPPDEFLHIPTPEHWLRPGIYKPAETEADLERITGLGMNAVAIGLPRSQPNWPNVAHFLDRCAFWGVRVYLDLPFGLFRENAPARAEVERQSLAALADPGLHLRDRPEVFAYSLTWEPHLGNRGDPVVRPRWNRIFNRWLIATFGSVAEGAKALED